MALFDLLHAGHVDFLEACRKIAGTDGRVVVALNRDAFVAGFKGAPPVCRYAERKRCLEAVRYVDEVIENSGDHDSTFAIEAVRPDFIVIGSDWAGRDYYRQMGFTPVWLRERGIQLVYVPRDRDLSSTIVKTRTRDLVPRPVGGDDLAVPTR